MSSTPLAEREKTAEELYIRKREAEKAAAAAKEKAQQEAKASTGKQ